MAYSNTISVPNANTEGGIIPPIGTTGRYQFTDNRLFNSNQILDEPAYPGQVVTIQETVQLLYDIYDEKLVTALERYFVPKYYLGVWQSLDRSGVGRVLEEGKSRYLTTTLRKEHYFTLGYKLEDGYTDYGLFNVRQCNFSLQPGNPISFEIAGIEINFVEYEVPSGRGVLFQGNTAIDRAYPRNDRQFRFPLSNLGLYTFQGAAITSISYDVRQVRNIPGEAYAFNPAICPRG